MLQRTPSVTKRRQWALKSLQVSLTILFRSLVAAIILPRCVRLFELNLMSPEEKRLSLV